MALVSDFPEFIFMLASCVPCHPQNPIVIREKEGVEHRLCPTHLFLKSFCYECKKIKEDGRQAYWVSKGPDNWLVKFGIDRHQIHCSGHAKGMDLFEIVETIDAKRCCFQSIQTEHPEKYVRVILLETYDCGRRRQDLPYLTVQTNDIFLSDSYFFQVI